MAPGGQPDISSLMKQAQQMQQQMAAMQEELGVTTVEGSASGGLVRAVVSGTGELQSVSIDPKVVDPDDVETLGDLVVAAVRDANAAANKLAHEKMGPLTGGLSNSLGLPG